MSGQEIERKFLVEKGSAYREAAFSSSHIVQGYIPCEGATVRIRKRDNRAYLTIKGRSTNGGLSRYEFETEIPPHEADQLLLLCRGGVVDKRRYLVKSGAHTFEIDEFYGNNEGLLLAEVELESEDETFEKPHFIGPEVTGDRRFYNSWLIPFAFGETPYQKHTDKVAQDNAYAIGGKVEPVATAVTARAGGLCQLNQSAHQQGG